MAETKLLIIDNDQGTRETLLDILSEKGYNVATASTGREAINKAKKTTFDAALVDIKLPDMDGAELLREFKKCYPEMVCIIITGHATLENAIDALKDGANGYFVKPLVIEKVVHRLEETLDKHRLEQARKVTDEALRESESKYRSLFDNMLDGFAYCKILLDKNDHPIDFVYLEVNDSFERLTGLKKEDVVGKKVTEAIPGIKDTHPELFDIYGKVALTGKETKFDIYFEPLEMWLSISVYSPKKEYFVAVFDDITKRKQAANEMKEIKENYDRITDNADEVIFRVEAKGGHVIYANPAAERLLGYSQAEWVADPTLGYKIIHPDYIEKQKEIMEEINTTKKPIKNAVLGWITKDGHKIILEYTIIPITDEKGKTLYFESIGRDITKRKQMEEKLEEYSEHLEQKVEERTRELKTVNTELLLLQRINEMLNIGTPLEEVFQTIVEGLAYVFGYDLTAIHLLDKEKKHLVLKAYYAPSKIARKIEDATRVKASGLVIPLYKGSILNEIVKKKKPVITPDVAWVIRSYTDKKALQALAPVVAKLSGVKWGMGVPLIANNEVIGVIGCGRKKELTEEDVDRLAFFGNEVSLAINKVQLYTALHERTDELGLLQKVNNLLNSGAPAGEVYKLITESLISIFHYHIIGIYILNEEGTHMICKSYHTDSKIVKKIEKLTGVTALNYSPPLFKGSAITKIVKTKRPLITTDIEGVVKSHTDKPVIRALAKTIAKVSGAQWGIGVPLLAGDKVVGVIGVGSHEELTAEDASRLAYFGDQVGLALEKSRISKVLEEKVEERTIELMRLKEFNENIVHSMEEGILMLDSNGHITYFNPKCTTMLGYPDNTLVGVHWTKLAPKGLHGEMEKKSQEWSQGKTNKFECAMTTRKDMEIPVIVSATPLFEEDAYTGSLLVLTDITEVKARERKLMEHKRVYDMRNGEVYLVKDLDVAKTVDVYRDLLNYGYSGLVITRRRPESLKQRLGEDSKVFWMSSTHGENTVPPNFTDIMQVIRDHLVMDTVVLLDRFEYMILQKGFRESVVFIQELVDLFYGRDAILLVSMDPRALGEEQLAILEEETREVELRSKISLSEGEMELLAFIYEQNSAGRMPSVTDILKGLNLSKPTVIKRIRILKNNGLIKESRKGRRKLLEVTEQGKRLL
ncbi:MAG: PAS domain S-box protein [Candidatus Hydrothermarchaeales archaeon]